MTCGRRSCHSYTHRSGVFLLCVCMMCALETQRPVLHNMFVAMYMQYHLVLIMSEIDLKLNTGTSPFT